MTMRHEDKVALVTGAGAGIGRAVAKRLASEGAAIVAVDHNGERLSTALRQLASASTLALECDIADEAAVQAAVAATIARFGKIDVLINNAGIGDTQGRLHEVPPDRWDQIMAVNVRGAFLMTRSVIPEMLRAGGGAIINMASLGSFRATAGASPYITSKGAMLSMTRAAALEYVRDNIRVNAVCPGTTNTEILANLPQEQMEMLIARIPQGRLGEPDEVAALVAFLASNEAKHITGGAYIIDGGRCAG